MFDEIKKQPDDIFAGTDEPGEVPPPFRAAPPLPQPIEPAPAPTPVTLPSVVAPPPPLGREEKGKAKHVFFLVLGAVIVITAGVLAGSRIMRSKPPATTGLPDVSTAVEENLTPTPTPPPEEEEESGEKVETDSDKDGLTDAQEAEFGTSSSGVDTDDDGLFDREEIEVYRTNPLVPDTDGDSYLDGVEVENGYNPNGAGKLFELPE